MLTQVHHIVEKDDIVMPEVDLQNVRLLIDRLIDYDKVGQMSFDDFANLQALLPDACTMDGIESSLSYDPSRGNYVIAQEALSTGMKVTLATVIAAAIAVILRFFRFSKSKNYKSGGPEGTERGSSKAALAFKKEISNVAPVFDTQIETFCHLIETYSNDGTLNTIDGDLYPELLSLMGSMYNYTKNFTSVPLPAFERSRDKGRIGEILGSYGDALSLGKLQYQWIQPYNYFFMTDKDLYPHLRFLEELFRYIKTNRSFETTIPDITIAIGQMRFQPARQKDFQAPGAEESIAEIFRIIENDFAPKEMARAVGVQVTAKSNFDAFLTVLEELQAHVKVLFGTDLYENGPGDDKFKQERMRAYYDFLTKDASNPVAETWTAITILVDQCSDLLKIAEGVMTKGGRVDFLSEAKNLTEELKRRYDNDMYGSQRDSKGFTEQQIQNLADLKDVGVFVTGLVRFVAEFTRIVEYTTRFEDKLNDLNTRMTNFTKVLIQVNAILKKVKE